jgi:hypothetical protein
MDRRLPALEKRIISFLFVASVIIIRNGYIGDKNWYYALLITGPLLLLAFVWTIRR